MDNLMTSIAIFIAGYIFGAISAYFILRKEREFNFEPKQVERIFILAIVTGIWAVSNGVAIFNANYDSPNALHALFGAVVGFYFDISIFDKIGLFRRK